MKNKPSKEGLEKDYLELRLTRKQLADKYNITEVTLGRLLKKYNLTLWKNNYNLNADEIIKDYNNGMTIEQIANKNKVSSHCIRNNLEKYNVKIRNYSESCAVKHNFLNKDDIIEYYKNHSWRDTVEHFSLSSRQFWYFIKDNNIY